MLAKSGFENFFFSIYIFFYSSSKVWMAYFMSIFECQIHTSLDILGFTLEFEIANCMCHALDVAICFLKVMFCRKLGKDIDE